MDHGADCMIACGYAHDGIGLRFLSDLAGILVFASCVWQCRSADDFRH
jgi:hypothetical protein